MGAESTQVPGSAQHWAPGAVQAPYPPGLSFHSSDAEGASSTPCASRGVSRARCGLGPHVLLEGIFASAWGGHLSWLPPTCQPVSGSSIAEGPEVAPREPRVVRKARAAQGTAAGATLKRARPPCPEQLQSRRLLPPQKFWGVFSPP